MVVGAYPATEKIVRKLNILTFLLSRRIIFFPGTGSSITQTRPGEAKLDTKTKTERAVVVASIEGRHIGPCKGK